MGYALLWIENLTVSLLLVATLVACLCHRPRPSWPWVDRWMPLVIVLLATCACLGAWWQLRAVRSGLFRYFDPFPLLILLLAGGVAWLMTHRWLRRTPVSSWGPRALALVAACAGIVAAGWLLSAAPLAMSTTQLFTILIPILGFTFLAVWLLLRRQPFWVKVKLLLLVVAVPPLAWLSWLSFMIASDVDPHWYPWLTLLVFVAVALVWMIRGRASRWIQVVLSVLAMLLPLAAYGAVTGFAGYLKKHVPGTQFPVLLALTVLFAAGAVWTVCCGLRRSNEDPAVAAAATWPRGKLAIGLGAMLVLHLVTFGNLDLAIKQQLAVLRAEAGALALSVAPARIPDRDNAGLVYQQAFEAMGPEQAWNADWDPRWSDGLTKFDPQDRALRELLDRHAPALALLREGGRKPGCYFDRDYGRPSLDMLLPEVTRMRQAAPLLAADARCRAADGDMRGALEDVGAMFLLAEHAGSEPILVMVLVGIAIDKQAKRTLEAVVAAGEASAEDLAAADISDHVSYQRLLQRGVRMEEALAYSVFCQVAHGEITFSDLVGGEEEMSCFGAVGAVLPLYRVFLLNDDVRTYREAIDYPRSLTVWPYYEAVDDWQRFSEQVEAHPRGIVAQIMVPPMDRAALAAALGDARRGVARLGLAMCRYRARHGRFPDKLEDLTPELITVVPRDPFDGEPIRLRRTNGRLVIYSIGPDMADDGGTPFDKEEQTGDIAFELTSSS